MLSVLLVIFRGDRIAGRVRIAGELLILFGYVRSRPADLHVWAIRFVDPCERVVPLVAATSSHAFVLTVSHGFYSPLPSCSDRGRRLIERSALRAPIAATSLPHAQGRSLRPSSYRAPNSCCANRNKPTTRGLTARSAFHHAPRRVQERRLALPDEVSRPAFSEPSALSLRCGCRFVLRATCLAEPCSGPSVGRTDPRSIPCLEPNGFASIIQAIFWIAIMFYRMGCR